MNKPLLFDFATSELSQDAFFAWLLAFADRDYSGPVHDFGVRFLKGLFDAAGKIIPGCQLEIEVRRQYKNIDIFCSINGTDTALVFEDKVHTREHGNQLAAYRDAVAAEGKYADIVCVYCKTGDQSDVSKVNGAGYAVVGRKAILGMLDEPVGRQACAASDIVDDFDRHLRHMDSLVGAFRTKKFADWDWNAWKGFYMAVQAKLGDGAWDYVANPAGGFMGFWWNFCGVDGEEAYLQLEESRACFKVAVYADGDADTLKARWNRLFIEAGKAVGVDVVRPSRLRRGEYMTVAILNGDIRVAAPDGSLDLDKTMKRIRSMERVLAYAVELRRDNRNEEESAK